MKINNLDPNPPINKRGQSPEDEYMSKNPLFRLTNLNNNQTSIQFFKMIIYLKQNNIIINLSKESDIIISMLKF